MAESSLIRVTGVPSVAFRHETPSLSYIYLIQQDVRVYSKHKVLACHHSMIVMNLQQAHVASMLGASQVPPTPTRRIQRRSGRVACIRWCRHSVGGNMTSCRNDYHEHHSSDRAERA